MSDSPLVLLTGITGFLATHCLDSLLADPAQYRVRGTLRSKAGKGEQVLGRLSEKDRQRVELIEVKDTASSDLSEALKDVDYVVHTASPYQLVVDDPVKDLLQPAIEGTLNLLRYAAKQPSIKHIAITSSFAAVTDFTKGGPNRPGFVYKEGDWNPTTWEQATEPERPGAFVYSASKKLAEKAAWDFVEKEKPSWNISCFNPPMIYGPTIQPGVKKSNLNTSSKTVYGLISSADQMPDDRLPLFCHARDVADAHTLALSHLPKSAGHRYLLQGGTFNWAIAVHHIAESHPQLKDRLPKGWEKSDPKAKPVTDYASLDTSKARELLGIKGFKTWKETLDECVDDLLELEKKRPDWTQ